MRQVIIKRLPSEDSGTFGQLFLHDAKFTCVTGELPWRDNLQDKSCIPPGTYICKMMYSPAHEKALYHVTNVPGRGDVEIHSGNWCGNTDLGLKSDVLGCILLGSRIGLLVPPGMKAQKALLNSSATVDMFMQIMNFEDFELVIS